MNRLFWGLLFCLLDYEVTVGSAVFEILPDFVGYFLLMKGMESLAGENEYFDRGRHWAFGLLIVSVLVYGANLMNPDAMTKVWLWAAELAAMILQLLLIRRIIRGLARMERDHGLKLGTERLRAVWLILAVLYPICHLFSWVPLVGDVCGIAALVMGILFLITFYGAKTGYPAEKGRK